MLLMYCAGIDLLLWFFVATDTDVFRSCSCNISWLLHISHSTCWFVSKTCVLNAVQYCSSYNIAFSTILQFVQYCNLHNIAVCTILQFVKYCNLYNIAVCTILQFVHYCSLYNISLCTIFQFVHYCTFCNKLFSKITQRSDKYISPKYNCSFPNTGQK